MALIKSIALFILAGLCEINRYDLIGRFICLLGVSVIMYWPRSYQG